jgi:type IV secretory pathway TrbD component
MPLIAKQWLKVIFGNFIWVMGIYDTAFEAEMRNFMWGVGYSCNRYPAHFQICFGNENHTFHSQLQALDFI